MSAQEWGPWIDHDGGKGPVVPRTQRIQVRMLNREAAGKICVSDFDAITSDFPWFFWRWRHVRTGWFKTERRRVCDDPAYAPIEAYRIRKPRRTVADLLSEIAARPPGQWITDATDTDRRLPKRVQA